MTEPTYVWALFIAFVLAMILLDLKIFHRKIHEIKIKEALIWSAIWILMAFAFNVLILYWRDRTQALEFLTGYLIEKSLSVDNLFVFLLIFSFFRVPARFHHTILFWGILGALIMRGLFIWLGTELVVKFDWIVYVFGVFLVYTGVKLLFNSEPEVNPDKSRVVRAVRKFVPMVSGYENGKFFVRRNGKVYATMMFLVLVFVETTDVIFAVDSIPAILAITQDRFIVFTSNVFAILGLRALYFALADMMRIFHYLNYGLSIILAFVGAKMILQHHYDIPIGIALGVVGGVLALSIIASIIWPKPAETVSDAMENIPK